MKKTCVGCGVEIKPFYHGQPMCCSSCWRLLPLYQKQMWYAKANAVGQFPDRWLRMVLR